MNPGKSQLIVFTKCFRHKAEMEKNAFSVKLFGQDVFTSLEAVFLGVTFDQRMTWEPQYRKLAVRAYKRLNLIRRIRSLAKEPNPNILAHLYQSLIIPVFEYSSLCIINAAEVHIEKLQLIQNMALRAIMGCPKYISTSDLHDCTGFLPIKDHLISFARKRLDSMQKNSPLVARPIHQYGLVRHIIANKSPLDVIYS